MSKRFRAQAFPPPSSTPPTPSANHTECETPKDRPIRQPRWHRPSLATRLVALKRYMTDPSYYDPYQREQVALDGMQSEEDARDQRPTKRRRSLSTTIMDGVHGFLCGTALAWMTARGFLMDRESSKQTPSDEKHQEQQQQHEEKVTMRGRGVDFSCFPHPQDFDRRLQQAEHLIRRICLQSNRRQKRHQHQQLQASQQLSYYGMPTNAAAAYCLAVEEDNNKWGLISSDDYGVRFLATTPPPKPARTYSGLASLGLPMTPEQAAIAANAKYGL